MTQIKLVIWDLDETFWEGTLSEGEVKNPKIELLRKLADYGIINSISSKNDYEKTKAKLIEFGVWDLFVFPSVNWNPKGESVKQIITDCQLRNPNILFIDDNSSNRNEVEYYNSGIITLDSPQSIDQIINWSDYKLDKTHERLKQYKILEAKKEYRDEHCSSNIDFLKKSNIRIEFIKDLSSIKNRLVEMIARTNQLNYTKIRITLDDLNKIIDNKDFEPIALRVIDNFGDYGICGFYVLDKIKHKLIHFLFSCRILNLGIENYVYQKLGMPEIDIIEPVSTKLDNNKVDWITEIGSDDYFHNSDLMQPKDGIRNKKIKLLLLGGCDLSQVCHYLENKNIEIIKDFNYATKEQIGVHREHTIFLKKVNNINEKEFEVLSKLPFLDENFLDFNFFKTNEYDYLIYSPLMNYSQGLYKHKKLGFIVPYRPFLDVTKQEEHSGFTKESLKDFKYNFVFLGLQKPEDFIADLEWLIRQTDKPVLFLNGAEIDPNNKYEIDSAERFKTMNKALEEFVEKHKDRCFIVDVRKFIQSRNDLEDNIRHYKRITFMGIAQEILNICSDNKLKVSKISIIKYNIKNFLSTYLKIPIKLIKKLLCKK